MCHCVQYLKAQQIAPEHILPPSSTLYTHPWKSSNNASMIYPEFRIEPKKKNWSNMSLLMIQNLQILFCWTCILTIARINKWKKQT